MKKKMSVILITSIVIAMIVITILASVTVLPWALIYAGIMLSPNPSQPEIKYGEFPFRLEYKINGQHKVIEDTIICEYNGIEMNEGRGKYRVWKSRLASGNENITLLKVDDRTLFIYPEDNADYLMGDSYFEYMHNKEFRDPIFIYKDGNEKESDPIKHIQNFDYKLALEKKLQNEYHIEIISWDCAKPIVNKFPPQK